MTALEDFARELACASPGCLCGKVRRGKVTTHCPTTDHVDRTPSFHITEKAGGRLLWICRAGCDQTETTAALQDRGLVTRRSAQAVRRERLDYSQRRRQRILAAVKRGDLSQEAAGYMLNGYQAERQRRRASWEATGAQLLEWCLVFDHLGRNYEAVFLEAAS